MKRTTIIGSGIAAALLATCCGLYAAAQAFAYLMVGAIAPVKGGFCELGEAHAACVERYEGLKLNAGLGFFSSGLFAVLAVLAYRQAFRPREP